MSAITQAKLRGLSVEMQGGYQMHTFEAIPGHLNVMSTNHV